MSLPAPPFCSSCGHALGGQCPASCTQCGAVAYANPLPVAVALVPMRDGQCLAVQRNIAPGKGRWALPGGFVDVGESIEQAAAREVREETGVVVEPGHFRVTGSQPTPDGRHVLLWCLHEGPVPEVDAGPTPGHAETQALGAARAELDWAFPLHRQAFEHWMSTQVPWSALVAAGWRGKQHPNAVHQRMTLLGWALRNAPDSVGALLRAGADPDTISIPGGTPLAAACKKGMLDAARLLLAAGAQINLPGPQGRTALHEAAKAGHDCTVQILLEAGAEQLVLDKRKRTAFMDACAEGHLACAQLLLPGPADELALADENGETALALAVQHLPVLVPELLRRGADPNSQDHEGMTPLMEAAGRRSGATLLPMLLEAGAQVQVACRQGRNALHAACEQGYLEHTRILLDAGADPQAMTRALDVPLQMALKSGHEDVALLLLQRGATALMPGMNVPPVIHAVAYPCVLKHMLEKRDKNDLQSRDWSLLMQATRKRQIDSMRLLLDAGALVEWKDPSSQTPLMQAVELGHENTTELLLQAGANPMTLNVRAKNAMLLAVRGDHVALLDQMSSTWRHDGAWLLSTAIQHRAQACLEAMADGGVDLTSPNHAQVARSRNHDILATWLDAQRERQLLMATVSPQTTLRSPKVRV